MEMHPQLALLTTEIQKRGALVDEIAGASERIAVSFAYPPLYLELIEHHSFVSFDIGGVCMHSNLKGEQENLEELFGDRILTETLCGAGFLPFGRLSSGSYDRVCFDVRRGKCFLDAPVVVMDHEAILSFSRIPKPQPLSGGLLNLFDLE